MPFQTISVIGLGYIGLPTAAVFAARKGIELVGMEAALEQAQVQVLLVDHAQFKSVQPQFGSCQRVVDTRGIWK